MAKLLVVPHPAHLNALAVTVASSARVHRAIESVRSMTTQHEPSMMAGGALAIEMETPPLRDILSRRREALSTFAAIATATTAKGISAMRVQGGVDLT